MELKTVPFMTHIPDNSIKLNIKATLLNNDDTMSQAELNLGLRDIRDGMIDGEEWENENVRYVLTEEGKNYLHD